MQAAKQAGKKLGRPKSGKIKGEDEVIKYYQFKKVGAGTGVVIKFTIKEIAGIVGVSKGTVQKIINKYKKGNGN